MTAIFYAIFAFCLVILTIMSFGIFAGKVALGVYSRTKNLVASEQQAVQRRQQQIERLKAMTPPVLLAKAPAEFFTYEGYWDWWRIPLVFPYSLEAIDSLDNCATLSRYKGGRVEDPNTSAEELPYSIMRYTYDAHWLLLQLEGGKEWGLFDFTTGQFQSFHSEQALFAKAQQVGFTGEMHLQTIREGHDRYFFPD